MAANKLVTFLWFTNDGEEAARYYTELFGGTITAVTRSPAEYPAGKADDVITVEFELFGHRFVALNGGKGTPPSDAISLQVLCDTQEDVDRIWDGLLAGGGSSVACGWIKDRWGFSWQVTPSCLSSMLADPDRQKARRAMEAMMGMVKLDIAALEAAYRG